MWAVVEIGGKQYKVKEGDILEVERIKKDSPITLDKVLLFCKGKEVKVGTPYLNDVKVTAEILEEKKGEKVVIFKYKRRKKYRRKRGHRQILSRLKISQIVEKKE